MKKLYKNLLVALALVIAVTAAFLLIQKNKTRADLTVSDLHIISKKESKITFSFSLLNNGDKTISWSDLSSDGNDGSIALAYIAQNAIDPYTDVSLSNIYRIKKSGHFMLSPGQSWVDTLDIDAPVHLDEGEFLIVSVDPEGIVKEANEENNHVHVPIYDKSEREIMNSREIVPLQDYLDHFIYEFPHEAYMTRIPEGKSNLVFQQEYLLNNKVILLDNGRMMGPLSGYAHSYKKMDEDIIWITTSYTGEYGADTNIDLYVINTKKRKIPIPYTLSSYFGEDGWYRYQDGEFIDDSTFAYRRFWNDDSRRADSTSGTMIIR